MERALQAGKQSLCIFSPSSLPVCCEAASSPFSAGKGPMSKSQSEVCFHQVFSPQSALRCYSKPPVTSPGRGFLYTQTQSPCPGCGQDVSLRHQSLHAGGQFLATCVLRGCSKDGITPNCPRNVDFPICPLTFKSSLGFCFPTPSFSCILRTTYETGVTRP